MVLSESFSKLWKDSQFRTRLTAVIVDEAHCIDEWGGDDFRPEYRQLERLRIFTSQEVPNVCCTAMATTSTFNIIWKTLGYGNWLFWGLNVGCDRANLFYMTRPILNTTNPLLDVLFILPQVLDNSTLLEGISKCLLYFDSENACRRAVQFIRKCLPAHLRSCVQAFSSNMSEAAKKRCWELFKTGEIRIICATDAAGMGCNIPDVKYVISFGIPKSVGTVAQRWGRAGRDRKTDGVCLLLVPKWAFRPEKPAVAAHVQHVQRVHQKGLETKADTLKRARLEPTLEAFINTGSGELLGWSSFIVNFNNAYFCDISLCTPVYAREIFARYILDHSYKFS
jgi:superfamily II DNA helicase RecQ